MTQPVKDTLRGTCDVHVDDRSYKREVLDANQPTIVEFYSDNPKTSVQNASRVLAGLARVMHYWFPEKVLFSNDYGFLTLPIDLFGP